MIPKIIHYCWLSDDPVPQELQNYMQSWKKKIPEYKFIKWDFSRFNKESSIWVSEAFDNKKYAFAADYIRLYAIYNYGGIYLDMDIEILKNFEPLLGASYMLAYERPSGKGIEAGCFGAEKGNSYIKDCLKYYEGRTFVNADGSFNLTPLPQIMYKVLKEREYNYSVYDHNYFTAKSYETGQEYPSDVTYAIHHFAGSWKTDDEKKVIEKTRILNKIFGYKVARNIAEYQIAFKRNGIIGVLNVTREKFKRKLR